MKNEQQKLPTKEFIKEKQEQIEEARNHTFTGVKNKKKIKKKKKKKKKKIKKKLKN